MGIFSQKVLHIQWMLRVSFTSCRMIFSISASSLRTTGGAKAPRYAAEKKKIQDVNDDKYIIFI